jgi:hypothetical protein
VYRFIELLEFKGFEYLTNEEEDNAVEKIKEWMGVIPRMFEKFYFENGITLSIQASINHYSRPNLNLANLNDYTHWEVAIVHTETGEFKSIQSALPNFASGGELKLYFDGQIYAFVPTDLVEEVYQALKELEKETVVNK